MMNNIPKSKQGFTLLEAVIALALWLILSAGIFAVWQHSALSSTGMMERQSAFENARIAMDAIKMNLQMSRTIQLQTNANDSLQLLRMNQRDPYGIWENYTFRFLVTAAPTSARFQRLEFGDNEFASNIANIEIIYIENRMEIKITTGCEEPVVIKGSVCVRYKDVIIL